MCELESKIRDRPPIERQYGDMHVKMDLIPALADLEAVLGCLNREARQSRNVDLTVAEHPHYASLGAVNDFIDPHIIWAYERQCLTDPKNSPYYFDCLKGMAKGRESEDLDMKVAMAVSAGEVGQQDIDRAYQYFGLDPSFSEGDQHIAGLYKSRIESAPRQKDEAREQLTVLAKARDSMVLEEIVNDKTLTYEEALRFLNVTSVTDADTIVAQATVQVSIYYH
jgi:ubiquitin carboxyl-terminal hydrolase 25/28